jgi:NAD(P)-dependent dehydrogenase (short-subunit alcohol dehydrogenase family)
MRVWFITGASRGLGLALTRAAVEAGDAVVATARDPEAVRRALGAAVPDERLLPVALDVTDPRAVEAAVAAAVARFGRLDVVVNNAGTGLLGAIEETSDAEVRSLFEVNFFGALAVTRAVLPILRRQGSGHLLMVTSLGGFTQPIPGWGIYGASKFALEGLAESLVHEVGPLGVAVTIVEPGSLRTDFLSAESVRIVPELDAYAETVGRIRAFARDHDGEQTGDPARAAAAILRVVELADPPLRLPLGSDALGAIEAKLAAVHIDLDATRELAVSTDLGS